MKKKATITIETERLLVLRRSGHVVDHWCDECRDEVKMIGVEAAAAIAGISQRALFRLAEAGEIHFKETPQGQALFCLNSLSGKRRLLTQGLAWNK